MAAPWKAFTGSRRVQAEYKHLARLAAGGQLGCVRDLSTAGDDLLTWRFKLRGFDNDAEGGRDLNADLRRLAARCASM
jgi:hypothetical protein